MVTVGRPGVVTVASAEETVPSPLVSTQRTWYVVPAVRLLSPTEVFEPVEIHVPHTLSLVLSTQYS